MPPPQRLAGGLKRSTGHDSYSEQEIARHAEKTLKVYIKNGVAARRRGFVIGKNPRDVFKHPPPGRSGLITIFLAKSLSLSLALSLSVVCGFPVLVFSSIYLPSPAILAAAIFVTITSSVLKH